MGHSDEGAGYPEHEGLDGDEEHGAVDRRPQRRTKAVRWCPDALGRHWGPGVGTKTAASRESSGFGASRALTVALCFPLQGRLVSTITLDELEQLFHLVSVPPGPAARGTPNGLPDPRQP